MESSKTKLSRFDRPPLFLLKTFKALNGLLCADGPLRNYSLTHSLTW